MQNELKRVYISCFKKKPPRPPAQYTVNLHYTNLRETLKGRLAKEAQEREYAEQCKDVVL